MTIYYVFMILSIVTYYLYKADKILTMRKLYCFFTGIFVFSLFALRDISLGMFDVEKSYSHTFYTIAENRLSYIFQRFTSDYLFYIFTKIITLFTSNINVYLAISALPIVCAVGLLIYRYSEYPWLSWIMFFCLGYFSAHVTIMRQSIAMALSIFMYMELQKENYKRAIILWFLAVGFHITAIISVVLIIIKKWQIQVNLKTNCIVLGLSVLCFMFSDRIFELAFSLISFERFNRYLLHLSSFNTTLFLINLLQCLFCVVLHYWITAFERNNNKPECNETTLQADNTMLVILLCSLPFYALTNTFSDIYRVGLYFSQFAIIAIPNFARKSPIIIRGLIIFILISIYFYYGAVRGLGEVSPYLSII